MRGSVLAFPLHRCTVAALPSLAQLEAFLPLEVLENIYQEEPKRPGDHQSPNQSPIAQAWGMGG